MKYYLKIFILLFLLTNLNTYSQDILPFSENFPKHIYKGDNQIWNVTKAIDHTLYFANNRFLLQYNGASWRHFLLPYKTIIRSVYSDSNRIYTGSYNEFGYWTENKGILIYHTLSSGKSFFKGTSSNEEIWKIFKHAGLIYFQSFNEMYQYDPVRNKIMKIKFPFQVSYCFSIGNELLVPTVNNGIYRFINGKFSKFQNWDKLKTVHFIGKLKNDFVFFTRKNGIFIGDTTHLQSLDHPLNEKFKSSLILSGAIIDSTLIVGTSGSGVYILDLRTNNYKNLNKENSLQNNTVLSVFVDEEKDIWLGLDNGIAHVEQNSPFQYFTDYSGSLGTVYSLIPQGKVYLIGSNHGIFELSNNLLKKIKGSEGQVWDIYNSGKNIIIGHNDGTFVLQESALKKVNSINGGWNFFKSEFDNCYYQTNYSGIAVYDDVSQPKNFKIIQKISKPLKTIVQNSKGILYVADNYRGVYRLKLDSEKNTIDILNITDSNNISNDFDAQILRINNKIVIFVNNKWYDIDGDKMFEKEEFNSMFKDIKELIPVNDKSFLFFENNHLTLVIFEGKTLRKYIIPQKYFLNRFVNKYSEAFIYNSKLFLNLDDGFMIFDYKKQKLNQSGISIIAYYNGNLIQKKQTVPFKSNIDIEVLSQYYGYNKPNVFYSFEKNNILHPVSEGHIILNNLSFGIHEIKVYTDNFGSQTLSETFKFKVARPWFISYWMMLIYFGLITSLLYVYYKWNHTRYLEKLKVKNEEMKHQKKIFELEIENSNKIKAKELEKHLLEIQIQNKASEVAVKSLSLIKHNEMVQNIEDLLKNEKNIEVLKAKIKKIIKIAGMDENSWKAFEEDLIRANNDFVEKLLKNHPALSSKDIKLCIYLRMNLSSKEIAPLMNISFRGVELHRYRLRKKLNINKDLSLNYYMLSI